MGYARCYPCASDDRRAGSVLERLIRCRSAPHRDVVRAGALFMAADGFANTRIAAARVHVSPATVAARRERFAEDGLVNFSGVRPGRGAKPSMPAEKVEDIVRRTVREKPGGETHWSCRSMARRVGVSFSTVQRIWAARGSSPIESRRSRSPPIPGSRRSSSTWLACT